MERVLVTGAEGFTGAFVLDRLARDGRALHAMVRPGAAVPMLPAGVSIHAADLSDSGALGATVAAVAPDAVIHLAGVASPVHGSVEEVYATNVVGTRHLLAALDAGAHRPRAVILASSANVYAPTLAGQIDEAAAVAPANDYGVSKLAMEHLRGVFGTRLPLIVVRPFNYTGVGQSPRFVIPKIIAALRERAGSVELGNIDVSRDWSDVRFVADCYVRLLDAPAAIGGTFNLCSGTATSLREVIDRACSIAGHRPEIRFNPAFARANEIPRLWGSPARLAAVIGPLAPIPIEQTLAWMLDGAGGSAATVPPRGQSPSSTLLS